MTERPAFGEEPPTKKESKKARQRARAASERQGAAQLNALADQGVELAMGLASEVAEAPSRPESERVIDMAFETADAAIYVSRRINEALAVGEWLDEVEVWVWQRNKHVREPLSEAGAKHGVEIRLEQPAAE